MRHSSRSRPIVEALEDRRLLDGSLSIQFLTKLYPDLLSRPVDATALAVIAPVLDHAIINRTQLVAALEQSGEYRLVQVQNAYSTFLHRTADPATAALTARLLNTGLTAEALDALLLGSDEYFTAHGATDAGFTTALYADAYHRAVDVAGQMGVDGLLAAGLSRTQVAMAVVGSDEARADRIQALYQQYLHRPADATSLATLTGLFQQNLRDDQVAAALLASAEYSPLPDPPDPQLSAFEVLTLLERANAATASNDAIIAIVDRNGRVLGVRVETGINPAIVANVPTLVFAADGALAEARTAAFFANDQAPITSRTVQFISQSTITQREVESNPSIPDPNSTFRGPGFVAPVGLGGHFPPGVQFTPQVDLFEIEHTNRDSLIHPDASGVKGTAPNLPSRFNVPLTDIPIPLGQNIPAPESYGFVSGIMPNAQARGIGTLPGGIPIYRREADGSFVLIGGIGVFFPGATGFASEENSALDIRYNPAKPDRSLEAEYIALAAIGGSAQAGFRVGALDGVPPIPDIDLPFPRLDLVGITLNTVGPFGTSGPQFLVSYGHQLGMGSRTAGTDLRVGNGGDSLPMGMDFSNQHLAGRAVPAGWLVTPHDGLNISAADVVQMVNQGIAQAEQTRAAIRQLGNTAKMVFTVTDQTGAVLGIYRMPDATFFSIDVATAKARNVAYYADPSQLQPLDQVAGLPAGVAMTSRTFRYLGQPRFPEAIDGQPPGPFSQLNDGGVNPQTGTQLGPPLPAAAYQSVIGHDAFFPGTNFHQTADVLNQNGIVFFPGSMPVYKTIHGLPVLVGGFGVSGDGVDQDDVVTFSGSQGFQPPAVVRADMYSVRGVRLPFQKFNRNPTG
jgi:uncharacterized protein GlcG (DUF336 family)